MNHEAQIIALERRIYEAARPVILDHIADAHAGDIKATADHEVEFFAEAGESFREVAEVLIFVCGK